MSTVVHEYNICKPHKKLSSPLTNPSSTETSPVKYINEEPKTISKFVRDGIEEIFNEQEEKILLNILQTPIEIDTKLKKLITEKIEKCFPFYQPYEIDELIEERFHELQSKNEEWYLPLIELFEKKKKELKQVASYIPHCILCERIAYHKCNSSLYILSDDYIVCKDCLIIYPYNLFECCCMKDNENYYTTIRTDEEQILFPAASKEDNKVIVCKECGNQKYINITTGEVICEKCGVVSHDKTVKVYSKQEYNLISTSIKRALIYKEKAYPQYNNCNCSQFKSPIDKNGSIHSETCNGDWYFGYFKNNKIIVCSKCKESYNENSFDWRCDKCNCSYKCNKQSNEFWRKTIGFTRGKIVHRSEGVPSGIKAFISKNHKSYNNITVTIKDRCINNSSDNSPTNSIHTIGRTRTAKQNNRELNMSDYKILHEIGQGSYATIYWVNEIKTNYKFALKKIIANDESELLKYKEQISLVTSISHQGIIQIWKYKISKLDYSTYAIYLLMPWCTKDIAKDIENATYNEEQILNLLKQITDTLAYIQLNNIAHRDIKPQNIMIRDSKYCLIDFDEAIQLNTAINKEEIKGTKMFLSPILYKAINDGEKTVIHNVFKSDVYSLGLCILYTLSGDYKSIINYRTKGKSSLTPILHRSNISISLYDILTKMLAEDENERYDFFDLQAALQQI